MFVNCDVFVALKVWRFGQLLASFNDANAETISPTQVSTASAGMVIKNN